MGIIYDMIQKISNDKDVQRQYYNFKNYKRVKQETIENSRRSLGFDFLTEYGLPYNFVLPTTLELKEIFKQPQVQKYAMPFSDKQFENFIKMKKTLWQAPISFPHDHHISYNQLMLGCDEHGQTCLFRFSTYRHTKDANNFHIKLDMCVGGADWLPLLRYDASMQEGQHTQYFDENGNFFLQGKVIQLPHLHATCEASQVICSSDLHHSLAKYCSNIAKKLREDPNFDHFQGAVDMFKEYCAIAAPIKNYNARPGESFFDNNYISYAEADDVILENCIDNQRELI